MATITIGGNPYVINELNFMAMERAWPLVSQAMTSENPMTRLASAVGIIAAGLMEQEGFNPDVYGIDLKETPPGALQDIYIYEGLTRFLKKKITATELPGIREGLELILKEAGLVAAPGETEEEETGSPSTETSPPSSVNLLQPGAREEAGTA